MKTILAIDTSCDETSAAVTNGRRVLASVVYSQSIMHEKWGGVVPSIAKRAHEERIDAVIARVMKKAHLQPSAIDAVAVTIGPGLAIALEIGIRKAKELALSWQKPLIAVNHMEGHIYSCFVQNRNGNPVRPYSFPYLALLVSGGHTEIVRFPDHLTYEVIGRTTDDAVGEALDKSAKILGFGYPGGPIIERLSDEVHNEDRYWFPRPMIRSQALDFSFSGLKTALLYKVRSMSEEAVAEEMRYLASAFQEAAFDSLVRKVRRAVKQTGYRSLLIGGGVAVNKRLRTLFRAFGREVDVEVLFPPYKYLNYDNAAMIGVVAAYKLAEDLTVTDLDSLDRIPRLSFPAFETVPLQSRFMKGRIEIA